MAGVKQFERSEVLDRAMALFWQRGYEATSIRDLVEATGINRGSIYGTFGDKQGLFLAVLDRYAEKIAKPMMTELSDPDPRRAVERMLDSIIRRAGDPGFPRGCLNTNTSLECPATGEEITRKIAAGFGQQETAIYRVLHKAQVEGSCSISSLGAGAVLHGGVPRHERGEQSCGRPWCPQRHGQGRHERLGCARRTSAARIQARAGGAKASRWDNALDQTAGGGRARKWTKLGGAGHRRERAQSKCRQRVNAKARQSGARRASSQARTTGRRRWK